MEHIETLTEADFDAVLALDQFAFQSELSADELSEEKEKIKQDTIWGWKEDGQLAAKVHQIPLSCYINGKAFAMGGIAGVASWPEYRRRGMVKHLLYHALVKMKENGQSISLLHPFSFAFYRKYGWEHAFTRQHYSLPMKRLKKKWNLSGGYVRRIGPDIPLLQQIYSEYASTFNGMLVRDEAWWRQRVLTKKYQIAATFNRQDEPEGYIIYDVTSNIFTIKEWAYVNVQAQKQLLHFIANHDSMADKVELTVPERDNLPLLLDEPRFEQKLTPYFMARIVDVQQFLQEYPFQDEGEFTLVVSDEFFPENSGTYQLDITAGQTTVNIDEQGNDTQAIHCSIQLLTSMLLNFRRPKDYYQAELITGELEAIERLEKLIPNRQTFLSDFF